MSTSNIDNGSIRTMSRSNMESNQNSGTALESNPQTEFDMASKWDPQAIAAQNTETNKTTAPSSVEPNTTTESESPSNDINPNAHNQPSIKDITKANAILSNFKTNVQAQDIIINLEEPTKTSGDIKEDRDYLVHEYFGQHIRPQRTTWVFFEERNQQASIPPNSNLLSPPKDTSNIQSVVGDGGGVPMDESTRNDFAKLVFLILLAMILVTGGFVAAVFMIDSLKEFFLVYGFIIAIASAIGLIGLCYVITCLECSRKFPGNVIVLVLSVVFMSCMCAFICCRYSSGIVFMALIATSVLVLVCFLLALSSFDFTKYYLYIVLIATALCALGLIYCVASLVFSFYLKPLHIAILAATTILQTVMLAMEIQMVLGGRTIEIGEDEYTLGAFMLYTSIVQLFMNCVQLLGLSFEDIL